MAGNVFFSVSMSLDGYIAPVDHNDDPAAELAETEVKLQALLPVLSG